MKQTLELKSSIQPILKILKLFIHHQYGGEVRFIDINQTEYYKNLPQFKSFLDGNLSANIFHIEGKSLFPLYDPPLGFLELTHKPLHQNEIEKIIDTIDFFMSLKDFKESAKQLEAIENRLRRDHNKYNNLIFLSRENSKTTHPIQDIDFWHRVSPSHIFIEGSSEMEIYKLALSYHHKKRRQAFVCYSDLEKIARCHQESLKSLGNITLYIPRLTELSLLETKALIQLIEDLGKTPSLVVGNFVEGLSSVAYFPQIQLKKYLLNHHSHLKLISKPP